MYVIVEIAGQQFKAEKGRKLYVHRLKEDEGSSVSFDRVLLTDNDGQVKVGTPVVKGASVNAKILKHLKDDKVLVFKKRRRKGYQKLNGHRQFLTQIEIEEITIA
jgi:large subunit ribosomal protein L21